MHVIWLPGVERTAFIGALETCWRDRTYCSHRGIDETIDRFHVTSHHFRSAILVYHFRLRNPRNFSTTIIPTSIMDSKEKEKESQNKSGVDYSFPISEYAKQLDFPVRDRYLQKIAAIGIDPVLVEGKDFKPNCLPPVESTDTLCYLVLETSFYTQKQFKAFRSLEAYNQIAHYSVATVQLWFMKMKNS